MAVLYPFTLLSSCILTIFICISCIYLTYNINYGKPDRDKQNEYYVGAFSVLSCLCVICLVLFPFLVSYGVLNFLGITP